MGLDYSRNMNMTSKYNNVTHF